MLIEINTDIINMDHVLCVSADKYNRIVVTFRDKCKSEYEYDLESDRDKKFNSLRKRMGLI